MTWASQAQNPGSNPGCRIMVKAYAPAHITGFFKICENDDPMLMGSIGCGIALKDGCVTEVNLSDETSIQINGIKTDAPTTSYVVSRLAKEPVSISSSFSVPIDGGFGASGSGALSTAFALNKLFCLNMTVTEVGKVAHEAEIKNKTGLGDVISQMHGGLVIRKEAGSPGVGIIDRIPVPADKSEVGYLTLGKMSTKSVLKDRRAVKEINICGQKAMKDLLKLPTLDNFMRLSKRFAIETGLISKKAKDVIEACETEGGQASMAMLGDVVFAVGKFEALSSFGDVGICNISYSGARLL